MKPKSWISCRSWAGTGSGEDWRIWDFHFSLCQKNEEHKNWFHLSRITQYHQKYFCKDVIHDWCSSWQDSALSRPMHHLKLLPVVSEGFGECSGTRKDLNQPWTQDGSVSGLEDLQTLEVFHCISSGRHGSSPLWCDLTNPLKLPCPPGLCQIHSPRGFIGAAG